jgi:hypothetical protein
MTTCRDSLYFENDNVILTVVVGTTQGQRILLVVLGYRYGLGNDARSVQDRTDHGGLYHTLYARKYLGYRWDYEQWQHSQPNSVVDRDVWQGIRRPCDVTSSPSSSSHPVSAVSSCLLATTITIWSDIECTHCHCGRLFALFVDFAICDPVPYP